MTLTKPSEPQMSRGLLPEAHKLILPKGIVSTSAPSIIATAERVSMGLDPWQKDIVKITWARLADGSLASDIVCMSIPRQSGKTYLVGAMVFAACLIDPGTTVAWTAHHNKVMLETFKSLSQYAALDKLAPHIKSIRASAEDRSINFVNGSRIVMAARESGALRGVAKVRILVLDEAQILTESALSDILPTQNAAEHPLTLMMGTPPRPKDPGEVFTNQRNLAIQAERSGEAPELLSWIELSADPSAETDDPVQLRQANPSYPHRTPARAINKLRRALSEDSFRREALGIWDDLSTPTVIPGEVWSGITDPSSVATTQLVLAVDISPDRTHSSVALAGLRPDGVGHVEIDRMDAGVGWVVDWVAERCANNPIVAVVIDARGPASSLLEDLKSKKVRVLVTNSNDMTDACADFYDGAANGTFRHIGQPQLTASMNSARKRAVGDRWAWNRKSLDSDITPIVAATLALWGTNSRRVRASGDNKQRRAVVL